MSSKDKEWRQEAVGFIEHYGFPCVLAWDGFHVYVGIKLNNFYNFKKTFSVSNMGLTGYNKWFITLTVNAPSSTHDARLFKDTHVFQGISNGNAFPN